MRNRFAIIILALAAIAVAFAARPEGEAKQAESAAKPTGAAANAVVVPFVYSTEKKQLMDTLVERFNRSQRAVVVKGQAIASGEVQTKIAAGKLKPVAWSPASSLWGSLLNYEADRQLAPESEPLLQTPLVIAMWEPMARAMGWPRQQVGFAELVRLARSGAGWGDFGHPQWGAFKLVHTNPDFSTSGLEAVVAEYYAATGKREGLTEDDISSRARRIVRDLERSIVHYGDTTPFIAEQLKKHGPGYASAAVMEETTVVSFNRTRGRQQRLVALYPTEGTFYSDSPFIVLNGDWVRPDQRRAAETFRRFLIEQITPEVAAQGGMRPADLDIAPVAPVTAANGVDPKQPTRVLGLPEPRVLARLKETWRADRKPANVLLVVDVSGSMVEEKRLERAKDGVRAFLEHVEPQDRIGLTVFSTDVHPLIKVGSFAKNRARLRTAVDELIADGDTSLYDATSAAFRTVRGLPERERRINAVVLLTDGEDTGSVMRLDQLLPELDQGDRGNPVRVFTISYSAGAHGSVKILQRISATSGGMHSPGDTKDIESVFRSISSYF